MEVKATFVQKGDNIDYKATTSISYMEIVPFAACVGVALTNIAAGETGTVSLTGVYEMPAASSLAISTGDAVFWNATNKNIDKTATGVPAGIAVADKAAAATTVQVRLCPAAIVPAASGETS